jgi:hypothetical protein
MNEATAAGTMSTLCHAGNRAVPIRPFIQPDAFEPEVVALMSEAFEAACRAQPAVQRTVIANRIIAAAKLGERDPLRLRAAALQS